MIRRPPSPCVCDDPAVRGDDAAAARSAGARETDRRTFLGVATALALAGKSGTAQAEAFGPSRHGLSIFGDLAYPPDFSHWAYVNPAAPKGGSISYQVSAASGNQNFNTFNTLNIFAPRGDGAAGMQTTFDSLMVGNADEADSMYGLVAESVRVSQDGLTFRFALRPQARFHDGTPLTADDVAFSLLLLKAKAYPTYRLLLREMADARALGPQSVEITFTAQRSREAPLIAASMPIFSKAYYSAHDFEASTLDAPLGSGPYRVSKIDAGRSITFQRVADYWGHDLPVNIGLNNFDEIRYEYFRDREAAFQAFSAGIFTYREEATSLFWATRYTFRAVQDGKVRREEVRDNNPASIQGWYFNLRRPPFQDKRMREAFILAMDFEWMNKNLMYGSYARTHSYFENSAMKAEGVPGSAELALLEPLRAMLDPAVFGPVPVAPVSDGTGQDRALLKRANDLLMAAGCRRDGAVLRLPDGTPLQFEFLEFEGSLQKHVESWIKNLKLLGINASIRIVDASQFQQRIQTFDFDIMSRAHFGTHTPGAGLQVAYGSRDADVVGSRNYSGIKDGAVDALIARAIAAETREALNVACRALDRVLRHMHAAALSWHKPSRWVANWDFYDKPDQIAKFSRGTPETWWFNAAKAQRNAP